MLTATIKQRAVTLLRMLRHESIALLAGLFGALAAVIVMGILRLWWGTLTPPELVGERLLPLMSAGQFVSLLLQFQPHPKTGPLALALLGQCVIGILLGPAYVLAVQYWAKWRNSVAFADAANNGTRYFRWPTRSAWIVAGLLALAMELLAVALFWPVLPAGIYGDPQSTARLLTITSLLLTFAAYAAILALTYTLFRQVWGAWVGLSTSATASGDSTASDNLLVSRRTALQVTGAAAVAIVVGVVASDALISAYLGRSNLVYEGHGTPGGLTAPITANSDFYVVSKNVLDPTVVVDRWRLELTGLVKQPQSWNYDHVRQLPSETRTATLECISNEVGGHLISTAVWRGVTLQTLLGLAGGVSSSAAKHVVFYGVDGYATSLPLADLLAARAFLAWEMNGVPLPDRHGFPLRAVVPGRYGEQNAKWVTRIDVSDQDFKGFYQSQGWSAAQLETWNRIDQPGRMAPFGAIPVSGVAFAGIRGIRQVEVSADGGASWQVATLKPPLSDQSWVFWNWLWRPANPGMYRLVARATDGTGAVQTAVQRGTVPDGAAGWPSIKVLVK